MLIADGRTGRREVIQLTKQSSDVQSHLSVNGGWGEVCVTWT